MKRETVGKNQKNAEKKNIDCDEKVSYSNKPKKNEEKKPE